MATTIPNSYHNNTEIIDGARYVKGDIPVKSATGADGNSYTTSISNDKLTNDDFLRLMLEEMKMQDPTKPMDSTKLMDSQLQMSTIETNQAMASSMEALTKTYGTSSLTNAVGLMGKHIENGEVYQTVDDQGNVIDSNRAKSFIVDSIESRDGNVYVNAREMTGFEHDIHMLGEADEDGNIPYIQLKYDTNGNIKDEENKASNVNVRITDTGAFELNEAGHVNLYDENEQLIVDADILEKYKIAPPHVIYSENKTSINVETLTKVI